MRLLTQVDFDGVGHDIYYKFMYIYIRVSACVYVCVCVCVNWNSIMVLLLNSFTGNMREAWNANLCVIFNVNFVY